MRLIAMLVLFCGLASAESYKASVAAVIAANTADTVTSWGGREGNPILGDRFGGRALGVKSGLVAASLGAQYAVTRRHPERRKVFTWINWAVAGGLGAVAYRNSRVR